MDKDLEISEFAKDYMHALHHIFLNVQEHAKATKDCTYVQELAEVLLSVSVMARDLFESMVNIELEKSSYDLPDMDAADYGKFAGRLVEFREEPTGQK